MMMPADVRMTPDDARITPDDARMTPDDARRCLKTPKWLTPSSKQETLLNTPILIRYEAEREYEYV
jgi:hypothetical protein